MLRAPKHSMKGGYAPITLGEQVKRFDVGLFALTEASYSRRRTLGCHAHDCATISFVLEGACIETIENAAYECTPFNPIIKPAGAPHANQYGSSGAKCLLIEVKPATLELARGASELLSDVVLVKSGAPAGIALRLYKEFQWIDSASEVSIQGLVLEMIGLAARKRMDEHSPGFPRWLREARELIEERFLGPVRLLEIAATVGVHPAYLSRTFRKHYKCTIGEYMRRLRLDYASEKMVRSGDSIADIAMAAGFYDQSHFTHAFKCHTGLTPAEFRLRSRKSKSLPKTS